MPLVVKQRYVDEVGLAHLACVYGLCGALVAHDAHVAHTLYGNVVQVLAAQRLRVVSVPARCHCGKGLYVLLAFARVEDEAVAERLEQGEIRRGAHRGLVDIVQLNVLLVSLNHPRYAVARQVEAEVAVAFHGDDAVQQVDLLEGQFLDSGALSRAFHRVARGHRGVRGVHDDALRRVNAQVDYLPGYAQAVELGRLGRLVGEAELSLAVELHRVNGHGAVKAHVLEVEHGVLGVGQGAAYAELPVVARAERNGHHGRRGKNHYARSFCLHCWYSLDINSPPATAASPNATLAPT